MKKHFFSPIPITKLNFYILISISLLPIFHILVKIILKVGLGQRFYFIIRSGKQIGDQTLVHILLFLKMKKGHMKMDLRTLFL